MVGGDNDVYTPNSVMAAVGDIVAFVFISDNHTISQSTFDSPCVKAIGGIDSGFMANMNGMLSPSPSFKVQVTTTAALCKSINLVPECVCIAECALTQCSSFLL